MQRIVGSAFPDQNVILIQVLDADHARERLDLIRFKFRTEGRVALDFQIRVLSHTIQCLTREGWLFLLLH